MFEVSHFLGSSDNFQSLGEENYDGVGTLHS